MAAELAQQDPYTLVAHHLQDGEATRAELKALTGLDYAQIEAALYRLVGVTECVGVREDGSGIEHYYWKDNAEPFQPQPQSPRLVPAEPAESREVFSDGVADDLEAGPSRAARPTGWSLAAKVREFLSEVESDEQFSISEIYDFLTKRYPNACETYEAGALRSQLTPTLNSFINKEVVLVSKGSGKYPNLYEKKIGANIDLSRVESLIAADLSITAMCAELGVSVATWTRHRKADPRLQAAYEKGIQRRDALEQIAQKNSDSDKPLSKSRQEVAKVETPEEAESEQPLSLQMIEPDKSEDKSESSNLGNFITTNQVATDIADFADSSETSNRATYALPSFIAELRAERDELDQLITLLERRAARVG